MLALPLYSIGPLGDVTFTNGALVPLPAELGIGQYVALYRRAPLGWHVCGMGYQYYVATDSSGTKYVVPGLVIEGERSPRKKLYFPPVKFTRKQIEQFVQGYLIQRDGVQKELDEARKEKEAELGILVHDLRALSSAIYNAALEAKTDLERGTFDECKTRIENVLATQTLLSTRIDGLDFAANPLLLTKTSEIPVFRRIDKIVRCFRAKGNTKRLHIELSGHSFGTILGPNVFELVPFALVDNAIKYSPAGQQIEVGVQETARNVRASFSSIGPKIDADEMEKVFEKAYRGRHATATPTTGTGIGLSITHKLITEHFGGSIAVTQPEEIFQIGLVPYCRTIFSLEFPRFQ